MCLYGGDVLVIDVSIAHEVHEAVDADIQELFCVGQRRGSAQMREHLHAIGMCLRDDGAIHARLELRDIAVAIVHPDLHEANASCMQLEDVIFSLSCCSRAEGNAESWLTGRPADWRGCDTLAHCEEAGRVRNHLIS